MVPAVVTTAAPDVRLCLKRKLKRLYFSILFCFLTLSLKQKEEGCRSRHQTIELLEITWNCSGEEKKRAWLYQYTNGIFFSVETAGQLDSQLFLVMFTVLSSLGHLQRPPNWTAGPTASMFLLFL
jgi:hypothetical protein